MVDFIYLFFGSGRGQNSRPPPCKYATDYGYLKQNLNLCCIISKILGDGILSLLLLQIY